MITNSNSHWLAHIVMYQLTRHLLHDFHSNKQHSFHLYHYPEYYEFLASPSGCSDLHIWTNLYFVRIFSYRSGRLDMWRTKKEFRLHPPSPLLQPYFNNMIANFWYTSTYENLVSCLTVRWHRDGNQIENWIFIGILQLIVNRLTNAQKLTNIQSK